MFFGSLFLFLHSLARSYAGYMHGGVVTENARREKLSRVCLGSRLLVLFGSLLSFPLSRREKLLVLYSWRRGKAGWRTAKRQRGCRRHFSGFPLSPQPPPLPPRSYRAHWLDDVAHSGDSSFVLAFFLLSPVSPSSLPFFPFILDCSCYQGTNLAIRSPLGCRRRPGDIVCLFFC